MSIQAVSAVLDYSEAEDNTRLVAISLANHADKYGVGFLSAKTIAGEAKCSERTAKYARRKLENLGEYEVLVEADGRQHRPALYRLILPGLSGEVGTDHPYYARFEPRADIAPGGVQTTAPEPVAACTPPVQSATPAHIEEPSFNRPTTKKQQGDASGDAAFLDEIFELWKRVTGRGPSTLFSDKRKRAIRGRLKEGISEEVIRQAVIGCGGSDWHMKRGRHAKRDGKPHTDLTLILRDPEHVEDFAKMAGSGSAPRRAEKEAILETEGARSAWTAAKELLRGSLPASTMTLWIEPLEVVGEREGKLVLLDTSDNGVGAWVKRRYWALILEATADFDDMEIVDQTQLDLEAS